MVAPISLHAPTEFGTTCALDHHRQKVVLLNDKQLMEDAMNQVKKFLTQEDGLAVTEYGLLLAFVAVAVITVVKNFGAQIQAVFTDATNKLAGK